MESSPNQLIFTNICLLNTLYTAWYLWNRCKFCLQQANANRVLERIPRMHEHTASWLPSPPANSTRALLLLVAVRLVLQDGGEQCRGSTHGYNRTQEGKRQKARVCLNKPAWSCRIISHLLTYRTGETVQLHINLHSVSKPISNTTGKVLSA